MYQTYNSYIISKNYDYLVSLSPVYREAEILKMVLEEIPIHINQNDLFACRYSQQIQCCETEHIAFPQHSHFTSEELVIRDGLHDLSIGGSFNKAHTCIDYGKILNKGLQYYINKVQSRMKDFSENATEYLFLSSMLNSLGAVCNYAQRYANLAMQLTKESNSDEKINYLHISQMLKNVPLNPAKNFYEAIQCVWLLHCAVPISENSWASISLGRFDQYMYPFFIDALNNGETIEQIKEWLRQFFTMLDSHGDGACALNIGGCDKNGNDQMNDLSKILIEVEKELCLRAPIFAVRLNPNTPTDIIDELIDYKLFSVGQPTFYGELPCRKAMIERGVAEQEAYNFSVNSCMGLMISGQEIADMWGCIFNSHLPLELAINQGNPLNSSLPFQSNVIPLAQINSIDDVLKKYSEYLKELLSFSLKFNLKSAYEISENVPNPFLSSLTEECIKNVTDRATGAKYNTVTVETMALVNTANAFTVIDTLVFIQKQYTLQQLILAAQNNYVGCDELLTAIKKCPKYGMANEYADSYAAKLANIFADVLEEFNCDNRYYLPSLHTLGFNVNYGNGLYATLDGRKSGKEVNKNAGPTNDVRSKGLTETVISAAKLPQYRFSGGQPIDLYFSKELFSDDKNKSNIRHLILSYFSLGGLQLQVNSVDIDILKKAYELPEDYTNIIVRKGGFSVRFADLNNMEKLEFIERFEAETI